MYIEPSTTIKFYSNIPLDNSYVNTLWFETRTAQNEYFHNGTRQKYTLSAQSYQRVEKGKMRVSLKADLLYDCNYLAFHNTNFGNKWFYAFITAVEYVSNDVCEVTFEIDVIQTYFLDTTLKDCFVERQHSTTDFVGDNIQPEPVELGEYVTDGSKVIDRNLPHVSFGGSQSFPARAIWRNVIVVMTAMDSTSPLWDESTCYVDGLFTGCKLRAFNATNTRGIRNYLNTFIDHPDNVLAIYIVPEIICPVAPETPTEITPDSVFNGKSPMRHIFKLPSVENEGTSFGGDYYPANKKLLTYPYNFVRVDNCNGQSLNLRYEFFGNNIPLVEVTGVVSPPTKVVLRPTNYKGFKGDITLSTSGTYDPCTSENITVDCFPMCAWGNDRYKEWLSQNWYSAIIGTIADGVSGVAGIGRGLIATSVADYRASISGNECRGNISSSNVNVSFERARFTYARCHVSLDYAKVIDNFFTRYGYAQNKVMTPNVHARQTFTYVKTRDCVLVGTAPADEIKRIKEIFDKGITFWANPFAVGDYTHGNPLLSEEGENNAEET